jgi:hypothetical protein
MSDYSKSTNFTAKDTLPTGNAGKIVKGTELDTEFTAIASAISSKADVSSPALLGTPTAPTASAGTNTTQLATTAFVLANSVPSGLISLWSGSIASVPSGWYLCNGSNGTPDLRNKFVIGAYSDNAGVANTTITGSSTLTGGSKDSVLITHTHTATSAVTDPTHTHSGYFGSQVPDDGSQGGGGRPGPKGISYVTAAASTGITVATTNANAGTGAGTNENLPPYYALAYIMKA